MKKGLVDIVTMGCSKNLVDSETLMRQFEANGYKCHHDAKRIEGEIAVVNTCGFIEDAKQESIDAILELAKAKEEGRIRRLYVMGCLSQRYRDELRREIPAVDKFYGKFDYKRLLIDLGKPEVLSCDGQRHITTPRHYAYLKISEGCDRHCAYCAIPLMTGRHVSRTKEDIISEVNDLARQGVKEFQVIAQELTYYGVDLYKRPCIAELVDEIAAQDGVEWVRLHYAYPNQFPLALLDVIRNRPNVCKYLDIALQHISDKMLSRMRRNVTKSETLELIARIREAVPGIHLRTTLMVGFPGETGEDFQELLDFVRFAKFERMGAFAYSEEDGTYSASHYKDDVPPEEKQRRLDELMRVQQEISAEVEARKVGSTMKTIIDRKEDGYYVGRTEYCSPDVDPEVLVKSARRLRTGCFYNVRITGSDDFDLYGEVEQQAEGMTRNIQKRIP